MVVKSATKKKLMDLGVPEPAAHILSHDRKWDDVKQLQLVDLPFVLSNLNLTSTELEAIHSIIQETYQKPPVQKWSWWNPINIQDLVVKLTEDTLTPPILPPYQSSESKLNEIFIGAPLLHLGYVYREGIDSEEPHKSPMFQLGIITNFTQEPQTIGSNANVGGTIGRRNGYIIEVDWLKSFVPATFRRKDGTPFKAFKSSMPWIQTEIDKGWEGKPLVWDPNPNPKEWKETSPYWKQGKGLYGPRRLIHSKQFNPSDSQLADVFLVLLNGHPTVLDAKTLENPSTQKVFTQERQLQTGDPLTIPADLRKMFGGFEQQHVFDEAIDRILPFLKYSDSRFAINWRWFLEHIGA
jgi:hypothetical protein